MLSKQVNNEKLMLEGLYIPSIEACWIYKLNLEKGNYEVEEKFLDKLLRGKIDWNFELFENEKLLESLEILEYNNKYYTLDIINIKFDNVYRKVNKTTNETSILDTKQLRDWAYNTEFKFNDNTRSFA